MTDQTPSEFPKNVLDADPQAFEDPLSNYDPPQYADLLERDLCEGTIAQMIKITPFATVSPEITIAEAVKRMAGEDSFALLVVDGDRLLGVVSERDMLEQVAESYEQVKDLPLRKVMTPEPEVVHLDDPPARAINLMATGGIRRLPVLDEDDRVVGVIGPKRTIAFLFEHL